MLLQILFNWQASDCSTNSNAMQLVYVLTLISRLFIQELFFNKALSSIVYRILMMLTSVGVFLGMGIYWAYTIGSNSSAFANISGNLPCFQNSIMFVI